MNLYFLVEGKRTEKKVYPAWLGHLVPNLRRVENPNELENFGYYIFSGEGYPSLLDVHLANTIKDYRVSGKFNRLVVCLDVDNSTPADRVQIVRERAQSLGFPLEQLRVIPQESCIESWFLGNRKAVSPAPNSSELGDYLKFYNVRRDDPESMGVHPSFNDRSVFHSRFFQLVGMDKRFRYTKHNPRHVVDWPYLEELIQRRQQYDHLSTFGMFLQLCDEISRHYP